MKNILIRKIKTAKSIKFILHNDGRLIVTAPRRSSNRLIFELVQKNKAWVDAKRLNLQINDLNDYSDQHFLKYKDAAKKLVKEKIDFLNSYYGFEYNKVCVKKTRSCWGSCSSKRNLNFNYKILFLSERLQDYIIIHELCHLQEMNHSKNFWSLVAKAAPDYRLCISELRSIQ
jgi:predicted metal-dependent hydrolase